MNELLSIFSISCAFCFFLEGLETATKSHINMIYKATHILYPLFIIGTLIYFLGSGVIE